MENILRYFHAAGKRREAQESSRNLTLLRARFTKGVKECADSGRFAPFLSQGRQNDERS